MQHLFANVCSNVTLNSYCLDFKCCLMYNVGNVIACSKMATTESSEISLWRTLAFVRHLAEVHINELIKKQLRSCKH
jgi:hypothetical protein